MYAIRCHKWLRKAKIIYVGERNTGQVSASHGCLIREIENADFLRDKCKPDAGVWTTKERKIEYLKTMNDILSRRGMRFLSDLIVVPDPHEKEANKRADMIKLLVQQLYNIQPIRSKNNSELVPTYETWSGKVGPDGKIDPKKNDDSAFATMMGCHWQAAYIRGDVDVANMSTIGKKSRTQYLNYQKSSAIFRVPRGLSKYQ